MSKAINMVIILPVMKYSVLWFAVTTKIVMPEAMRYIGIVKYD